MHLMFLQITYRGWYADKEYVCALVTRFNNVLLSPTDVLEQLHVSNVEQLSIGFLSAISTSSVICSEPLLLMCVPADDARCRLHRERPLGSRY